MRLIKLSKKDEDFKEEKDLQNYFTEKLRSRNPPGLFVFPAGWISENGLRAGETILFSYNGRLRYVAKTATERFKNTKERPEVYPYCIVIAMESLCGTDISLLYLEQLFNKEINFKKSLRGQGWVKIPDSDKAEDIIKTLILQ